MHASTHSHGKPPPKQCTHIHRDALLADGEQLKPGVGALARLGEAVYLDGQVVTLGVPEDVDVCSTQQQQQAGCATAAVSRCATSRATQSCCCCCCRRLTERKGKRCAALRRCLPGCCGQPERPQRTPPPLHCPPRPPRTADVEQLLAAHSGPVRDFGDGDVGRPVANLLGIGSQQRLSRRPLKVLRRHKTGTHTRTKHTHTHRRKRQSAHICQGHRLHLHCSYTRAMMCHGSTANTTRVPDAPAACCIKPNAATAPPHTSVMAPSPQPPAPPPAPHQHPPRASPAPPQA